MEEHSVEERFRELLLRYWGFSRFRPLQKEIIDSVVSGRDTLALLPTGGGKSLTFQIPALALEGICIVITPLIALMRDQVIRLRSMEIKAQGIHSGMTSEEIDIALENCAYGDYKFLYISPERIASPLFKARVRKLNVNLVAVDEAHCISQWGYDFRPSYLRIAELREILPPGIPILALTATATSNVVDDIVDKLRFSEPNILKSSFRRDNITYVVRKVEDKGRYLRETLGRVRGSGIIYVRNRKKTKEIAEALVQMGITADHYHAGLPAAIRERRQVAWSSGEIRVIVATNAFGMGIDKADVRFVIHWDIPDCIESYFQESGRVGRDGKSSYATLLWTEEDRKRISNSVKVRFPPKKRIKDVYEALANFFNIPIGSGRGETHDFSLTEFVTKYRFSLTEAYNSLLFLQREGYIEFTEEINNPSRVRFLVGRDDLYKFQVANESFDSFIKLLLRSYTGMFSEYVPINEDFLASKTGAGRDTIYQYLIRLASQHIISYIPGKKTPFVIFTEERLERKSLLISDSNYNTLKERYSYRLGKMLDYVTNQSHCRTLMLLNYFGEEGERCGVCDICRSFNETDLSKYEFETIREDLRKAVEKGDMTTAAVAEDVAAVAGHDKDKVIKVIRWLLDHNELGFDEKRRLHWKI